MNTAQSRAEDPGSVGQSHIMRPGHMIAGHQHRAGPFLCLTTCASAKPYLNLVPLMLMHSLLSRLYGDPQLFPHPQTGTDTFSSSMSLFITRWPNGIAQIFIKLDLLFGAFWFSSQNFNHVELPGILWFPVRPSSDVVWSLALTHGITSSRDACLWSRSLCQTNASCVTKIFNLCR